MKVVVCGSRDHPSREVVFDYLNCFHAKHSITYIIEGGARRVDRWAWEWAIQNYIRWSEYIAEWKVYGLQAGLRRNQIMINQKPDAVIAFYTNPTNPSTGTKDCVDRATKAVIPVYFGHEPIP